MLPMDSRIKNFVDVAGTYCSLIENHGDVSVDVLCERLQELLPLLYYHAVQLPEPESMYPTSRDISHREWKSLFDELREKFGDGDSYWCVYNPLKLGKNDPLRSGLSDDLADIWRDLKNGVIEWQHASQESRRQIVYSWHFSFHSHWSDHVVDALRTINRIVEDRRIEEL